jgi:hypothetical protein
MKNRHRTGNDRRGISLQEKYKMKKLGHAKPTAWMVDGPLR